MLNFATFPEFWTCIASDGYFQSDGDVFRKSISTFKKLNLIQGTVTFSKSFNT